MGKPIIFPHFHRQFHLVETRICRVVKGLYINISSPILRDIVLSFILIENIIVHPVTNGIRIPIFLLPALTRTTRPYAGHQTCQCNYPVQ